MSDWLSDKIILDKDNDPYGWIQWKGTDVCMDVHCVCGNSGHIDADFAYYVKCPVCGRYYEVSGYVKLYEHKDLDKYDKENAIDIGDYVNGFVVQSKDKE